MITCQKALIIIGIMLIAVGILWPTLRSLNIGRLPGDLIIKGKKITFYFPIVTCIIISLVCMIVAWILKR